MHTTHITISCLTIRLSEASINGNGLNKKKLSLLTSDTFPEYNFLDKLAYQGIYTAVDLHVGQFSPCRSSWSCRDEGEDMAAFFSSCVVKLGCRSLQILYLF